MARSHRLVLLVLAAMMGCSHDETSNPGITEPAVSDAGVEEASPPGNLQLVPTSSAPLNGSRVPDVSASFRFLPPIGPDVGGDADFDSGVYDALSVTVCLLAASECAGPPIATYGPGKGSTAIRLETRPTKHFLANWPVRRSGASAGQSYRVAVQAAGLTLGSVDTEVRSGDGEATGSLVVLIDQALPVSFQVDTDPVIRAWVLRADGVPASEAAARVADEFGLDPAETASVLHAVGYTAADVAAALRDAFGLGASDVARILSEGAVTSGSGETADALLGAGFALQDVASALASVFGLSPEEVAGTVADLGYGATDIATALSGAFGSDAETVAGILFRRDFTAVDTAEALRSAFSLEAAGVVGPLVSAGFAPADLGLALAEVFSLDAAGVATALKSAGWGATDIAALLRDAFESSLAEAITALDGAGFSLAEVAAAADVAYGPTEAELASALLGGPYALTEVATWLQSSLGKTDEQTLALFQTAGVPGSEVGDWLVSSKGRSHEEASTAMRGAGFDVAPVADWLLGLEGFTEETVVQTLRTAGFEAGPVADWLFGTLGKARDRVVGLLAGAGFDVEPAMQWLEDRFSDMTDQLAAAIAKGAGWGGDAVTRGIQKVYGLGEAAAARVLKFVGFSPSEAADALGSVYGIGEARVAAAMDFGGYALGEITDWLEGKGLGLEGAVGVLQAAGIEGGRVVGMLKERVEDVVEDPAGFVFNLMAAVGYGFQQFASGMVEHFGDGIRDWLIEAALEAGVGFPETFALADVLGWGYDVGQLTLEHLAEMAERKGIPVTELVDWLTTKLPGAGAELAAQVIGVLERAGYETQKIATGLVSFGLQVATQGMALAGWTAAQAGSALEAAYGLGEATVVALLDQGGFALGQVAGWLENAKGKTLEQIVGILHQANIQGARVVDMLVEVYNQPAEFVFSLMSAVGYGFTQFASRIFHHFGDGITDWLIGAALDAGLTLPDQFSIAEIADFAVQVAGLTTSQVLALMERRGIPAGDAIDWLTQDLPTITQTALNNIAVQLKGAGYNAQQVATGMLDQGAEAVARALKFANYQVSQVGDAIEGAFDFLIAEAASVLRGEGYTFGEVVDWIEASLSRTGPATISGIVDVADSAGFDVHEVATVLKSTRGVVSSVMAAAMKAVGYDSASVSGVLHDVYELAAGPGASVMNGVGFLAGEIAGALVGEWSLDFLGAAQVLYDLYDNVVTVIDALSQVMVLTNEMIQAILANLAE